MDRLFGSHRSGVYDLFSPFMNKNARVVFLWRTQTALKALKHPNIPWN